MKGRVLFVPLAQRQQAVLGGDLEHRLCTEMA